MSSPSFIGGDEIKAILVDALTSFSPLAVLVGSDSARKLSNHASNTKQAWAASLTPIGSLGIMATVCRGVYSNGPEKIVYIKL